MKGGAWKRLAGAVGLAGLAGTFASALAGRPRSRPLPYEPVRRRGPRAAPRAPEAAPALELEAERTAFAGAGDFVRRALEAYRAAGLGELAAPLLAAHSAWATGFGRNVWNFNIGVILATPAWIDAGRPFVTLSGPFAGGRRRARWRAYASLEDSARDVLALLRAPRYARARELLEAGDAAWHEELGRAGWFEAEAAPGAQAGYVAALRRVRRLAA